MEHMIQTQLLVALKKVTRKVVVMKEQMENMNLKMSEIEKVAIDCSTKISNENNNQNRVEEYQTRNNELRTKLSTLRVKYNKLARRHCRCYEVWFSFNKIILQK